MPKKRSTTPHAPIKGLSIRVIKPAHMQLGTLNEGEPALQYAPQKGVYTGRERRSGFENRTHENDLRKEWRENQSVKPPFKGRREAMAWREYIPTKYAADKALPKEWFTKTRQAVEHRVRMIAKEHSCTRAQAIAHLKIGPEKMPGARFTTGKRDYLIGYDPSKQHFYWASTRRKDDRRKAERRDNNRVIRFDARHEDN
ncbi:MAG: hypothetical protein HY393_03730 [Candidatus Diapherotrites archaeon]|nr:hypothetical protein [Candidatus Diapherotrites archaeon]